MPGQVHQRVVVASYYDRGDPGASEPSQLGGQASARGEVGLRPVEHVPCQDQCVGPVYDGRIDDPREDPTRSEAQPCAKFWVAQRDAAQWRVEMQIGGMDEAHESMGLIAIGPPTG